MRTDDEVLSGRVPGGRARGKFSQFSCRGLPSVQQQYLTGLYSSGRSFAIASGLCQTIRRDRYTRGIIAVPKKTTRQTKPSARAIAPDPMAEAEARIAKARRQNATKELRRNNLINFSNLSG